MKEQFRNEPAPIQSGLTTNPSQNRLRGGDIFMPDGPGIGEGFPSLHQADQKKTEAQILRAESVGNVPRKINFLTPDEARGKWRNFYLRKGIDINDSKNPLSSDERITVETAIQRGLSPIAGGADAITPAEIDIAHLPDVLARIVQQVNDEAEVLGPDGEFDPRDFSRKIERVEGLIDQGKFITEDEINQARELIKILKQREINAIKTQYERRRRASPEGLWYTLKPRDFELLIGKDYEGFVNKWFDTLYAETQGRDPTTGGSLDNVQRAFQEASTFVVGVSEDLEGLGRLTELFETRIRLLTMNWGAISSKSMESIQKGSYGLRAHGLLMGATLDKGYTGEIFNRMTELLEDERLKETRGHLTPELTNRIPDLVREEILSLRGTFTKIRQEDGTVRETYEAGTGIGSHAGKKRQDIERAIRSAYDLLNDSQRIHILASRGKELFAADAFYSDAGAVFKVFNPKTFISEKWGQLTPTDQRFLREVVEKSLIDEWLEEKSKHYGSISLTENQRKELGDLLFKTLDSPADFFSSGWRMKGMRDQLMELFTHRVYSKVARQRGLNPDTMTIQEWQNLKHQIKEERDADGKKGRKKDDLLKEARIQAENFGLFVRVKSAKDEDKGKIWKNIEKYRPEEIIRLLREKYSPEEVAEVNKAIFGDRDPIKSYDDFKKEFGPVLRAIREQGFKGEFNDEHNPEQINFAEMTQKQYHALSSALGVAGAEKVKQIYASMQRYIRENRIAYVGDGDIVGSVFDRDCRFADLYDKVIAADDLLLGNLEELNDSQKRFGMLELSKMYANDLGGDAYVRNMNDLASGNAYIDEMMGFLREVNDEEKFKHAEQAALKASDYNGRKGQAAALRHTIIPFMWASMPPGFFDTLGVGKLPLRRKMTLIEKIYGYHAKPLLQDQRREMFDKIEARLEAAIQNELNELEYKRDANTRELRDLDPELYNYEEKKKELKDAIDKYPEEVKEVREKGLRFRHSAEKLTKVRGRDLFRQKASALLLFLLIALLAEFVKTPAKNLKS